MLGFFSTVYMLGEITLSGWSTKLVAVIKSIEYNVFITEWAQAELKNEYLCLAKIEWGSSHNNVKVM